MRIDLPDGLFDFASEFSRYKTPDVRTQGWEEEADEDRGQIDIQDTIGTLMLWRFLAEQGIHCTYLLTANGGDETDIRVHQSNRNLDINVKTSAWQPDDDSSLPALGCIAVKTLEFKKPLPAVYAQVIVHINDHDGVHHVHLCNFIPVSSEQFKIYADRRDVTEIPRSKGTKGLWIPSKDAAEIRLLPKWLRRQSE